MKKRQCVLCNDGKVVTSAPKDKAVCHKCATELIDGDCNHEFRCDCPCHQNPEILHIAPCCYPLPCPHCGKRMDDRSLEAHIASCHKTLLALLA